MPILSFQGGGGLGGLGGEFSNLFSLRQKFQWKNKKINVIEILNQTQNFDVVIISSLTKSSFG